MEGREKQDNNDTRKWTRIEERGRERGRATAIMIITDNSSSVNP